MVFELTILGTNAALPVIGRSPSAQVLQVQHRRFLIDCGEGTQLRLLEAGISHARLDQIFISHLHGDHVFGLIGLLSSWQLGGRRRPLDIFAPEGLQAMLDVQLQATQTTLQYPLRIHLVDPSANTCIYSNKMLEVWSLPLRHRIPTMGFLFREKKRPDNILSEKVEAFGIPYQDIPAIKAGGDWRTPDGRLIPHDELTVPAPPPRSFAYCSDTAYEPSLIPLVRGVDLLYHEATFCEAHRDLAELTLHSTARQAAMIAREASVGKLILGHFSSRYQDVKVFAEEARPIFQVTVAGYDGMRVEVPFRR